MIFLIAASQGARIIDVSHCAWLSHSILMVFGKRPQWSPRLALIKDAGSSMLVLRIVADLWE
jgi:hypothetical protein